MTWDLSHIRGMETYAAFLQDVSFYCERASIAESTLSRRLFNDGKVIGKLRGGKEVTVSNFIRARSTLNDLIKDIGPEPT